MAQNTQSQKSIQVTEADINPAPWLSILGAAHNNLKNLDVHIPLARFVCVTGVSGSGKSSLINDILREQLLRDLNEAENVSPGVHRAIEGKQHLDKIIDIDQSPIGRTPRSNPATYIKLFDDIRDLYTKLPESKLRGYKKGRFSFNVASIGEALMPMLAVEDRDESGDPVPPGAEEAAMEKKGRKNKGKEEISENGDDDAESSGKENAERDASKSSRRKYNEGDDSDAELDADESDSDQAHGLRSVGLSASESKSSAPSGGRCEVCQGNGSTRVEMDFLADVWVTCPVCEGNRFNRETLGVKFRGKSIADVLDMDVQEALEHFANIPQIATKLKTLHDVGLDYVKLGQSSTTLSGGEAQRIKLAKELTRRSTGRTLYVLDEPTTGLHFEDVRRLLEVLHGFVDAGNSVIVIEHHLDVIKTADWIIDLGLEGGDAGGELIVEGTPEEVAACERSYTGQALREVLGERSAASGQRSAGAEKTTLVGRVRRPDDALQSRDPEGAVRSPLRHNEPLPYGRGSVNASAASAIQVSGAKEHNLRDISVDIPRNAMTICSGVSGSGKSSFAIDTVYTEGHRRYVESLSAYARQFLGQLQKPKVDHIHGLSPAIAIEQGSASKSPRSTVGTVTEIYDYMRILWARLAKPYCPKCNIPIGTQTTDEIVDKVVALPEGSRVLLCAPVERGIGETYATMLARQKSSGFVRARVDGVIYPLDQPVPADDRRRHRVQIVVDRIVIRPNARGRLADSVEQCLSLGQGVMLAVIPSEAARVEPSNVGPASRRSKPETGGTPVPQNSPPTDAELRFSQRFSCEQCGTAYEELTPHHFSFNNRMGWCNACEGLGVQRGTQVDAIAIHPDRSILDGALMGFERLNEKPLARSMLEAIAGHIGFDANTPWNELKDEHQHKLLFGTGEAWIGIQRPKAKSRKPKKENPLLRFQFKGFFPAIDEATRVSWQYRFKLDSLVTEVPCQKCEGGRVRPEAAAARLGAERSAVSGQRSAKQKQPDANDPTPYTLSPTPSPPGLTILEANNLPLAQAYEFFTTLPLDKREKKIAGELLREINARLKFLLDVGLDYLALGRAAPTLSGGEAQRIRLASQIGSGLTGVLYVLDEPTIGLHPRDNARLIKTLHRLRDLGNTLLIVEHDREVIQSADHVLDFGPGAGSQGGHLVGNAAPAKLPSQKESITGAYLAGREAIAVPTNRRGKGDRVSGIGYREENSIEFSRVGRVRRHDSGDQTVGSADPTYDHDAGHRAPGTGHSSSDPTPYPLSPTPFLTLINARQNNLKNLTVTFPLNRFICVTGVSGSGKSSLITDTLYPALAQRIHRAGVTPGPFDELRGIKHLDKVINVDQAAIGTSPKSNPATYTGLFDLIRELFARLPDSKVRGYTPNRFSFNRPGGRCEACEGLGEICHEMHFLPDVWVTCDTCHGARYNPETLDVRYKGKSIADVLNMSVAEAIEAFANIPKIKRLLQTLADVGLDYMPLGQSAGTLSGGEAQRVKLAAELARPATGRTIYILDEPTTGLHLSDIRKLLDVLHRFVDMGNTVLCVEHNLDVIKTADWIIDLGPEAGEAGGQIVAEGTPEAIVVLQSRDRQGAATVPNAGRNERQETPVGRVRRPDDSSARTNVGSADPTYKLSSLKPQASSHLLSHTALALAPVLAAGPFAERPIYDPKAAAKKELDKSAQNNIVVGAKDSLELSGADSARLPWEVDGRRWHTLDRPSRNGEKVEWAPELLEHIIGRIEKLGGEGLAPTNWNDRVCVEIRASARGASSLTWFLHVTTGGKWLLELAFRVPRGTFKQAALEKLLGLKTHTQRGGEQIHGNEPRAIIREVAGDWDNLRILIADLKEVKTRGFDAFLATAVTTYIQRIEELTADSSIARPWETNGKAYHLAQKAVRPGVKPEWTAAMLIELIGRMSRVLPRMRIDWNRKLHMGLTLDDREIGKIHTYRREGILVELFTPNGGVSLTQAQTLGREVQLQRGAVGGDDRITFWAAASTPASLGVVADWWKAIAASE